MGALIAIVAVVVAYFTGRAVLLGRCRRAPTAEISGSNGMYVKRWHLVWNEKRFMAVVHRFFSADLDPPHNHSGVSFSIVLAGRGVETYYSPDGKVLKVRKRFPGQVVWRTSAVVHRLDSTPEWPLTTLFLLLPQGLPWGFFTPQGFVEGVAFSRSKKGDKKFAWVKR